MKTVELLATFLYKGYINHIKEACKESEFGGGFLTLILNELNALYLSGLIGLNPCKALKKLGASGLSQTFDSTEDFERLINYKLNSNFEAISADGEDTQRANCYLHTLEVLYVFAFKLSVATSDKPIDDLIENSKHLIQYKHIPLSQ